MAGSDFWFVLPLDPAWMAPLQGMGRQGGNPMAGNEIKALGEAVAKARVAGGWGAVNGSMLRFNLGVHCTDSKSASQIAQTVESIWNKQGKGMAGMMMMAQLATQPPAARTLVKELMDSLQFSSKGFIAQLSASISMDSLKALAAQTGKQQGPGVGP
jgi:hypothetical protein